MKKYFEIELKDAPSHTIEVRPTDTTEAWRRDYITNNPKPWVTINGTSCRKDDIINIKEVRPRKGSTKMEGI
jgi:hypothetical protein